jgi:aerobic-type carbon monoxide dehydrogenase small subunit (CoxS/CutS family)
MPKRKSPSEGGISRRSFIKGVGITAAGTSVLNSGLLEAATGNRRHVVGPGATDIVILVNGRERRVTVEPRTTLAEAMRYNLDLTGTKVICDRGSCSGCTVWLDGVPVNSCITFALDVGQRKVTTIEGLGTAEHLHPLQAAFVDHDGMQCGYCTPGMVMSCAALLEHNANPSAQDVQQAISGNLCRCGTYPKVVEATLAAARSRKGA